MPCAGAPWALCEREPRPVTALIGLTSSDSYVVYGGAEGITVIVIHNGAFRDADVRSGTEAGVELAGGMAG